jgi:cell division protein FtsW
MRREISVRSGEPGRGDEISVRHNFSGNSVRRFHSQNNFGGSDSAGMKTMRGRAKLAATTLKSSLFDTAGRLQLGRRHRPDYVLIMLIAALALTGLMVIFSISPAWVQSINASGQNLSESHFMVRQLVYLLLGWAAFFVAAKVPLDFWRKAAGWILAGMFLLCLAVPVMGALHIPLATCANNACRWYNIGVGTIQPAEFLKIGVLLWTSSFLAIRARAGELNSIKKTLLPYGVVMAIVLLVIAFLQKDLGTAIALVAISLSQLIISGAKLRTVGVVILAIAAAGILAIIVQPYRVTRLITLIGGGSSTDSYHIDQALIALGSGGFGGRGLGQSVQAFGWLPESVNDSIFAIIGESFGFIGVALVLTGFFWLLKRIISKADFLDNLFLRLVVAGVFGWLAAHVLINVGSMIGLLPLTGITLPLLSFGGTSMMAIMTALGIVFAISRYTSHRKVNLTEEAPHADFVRGRRQWRTRYAGRRGY